MKFKVRDAKFSFLINTVKPIILGAIKRGVAVAIQEAIRNGLVQIDAQLADISERIDRAKDDDNVSTLDAIKDSFIDKKEQAQQKKDELTRKFQSEHSSHSSRRELTNIVLEKLLANSLCPRPLPSAILCLSTGPPRTRLPAKPRTSRLRFTPPTTTGSLMLST